MPELYVLADITPAKIAESQALAELLHGLDPGDLIRVFSSAGHELLHRYPERTVEEVIAELAAAVKDVHDLGLP